MNLRAPTQRFLAGTAVTPVVMLYDEDGDLASAAGAVTCTVSAADGTAIVTAVSTTESPTGVYTLDTALTAAQTADLDLLACVWTDAGDSSTHTTLVELCGGHYFSVAEARAFDASLADATKYPAADIIAARLEVEWEAEWICDRAFVPRFARLTLDGTGNRRIFVPAPWGHDLRSVTAASIDDTALTAAQIADLELGSQPTDNFIDRPLGAAWTEGTRNVVIEIEYGLDEPPPDLPRQAVERLRSFLNQDRGGVPSRATSFTVTDGGGTYALDTPDAYRTGIPPVDAVYQRYSLRADARSTDGGAGGSMPPPKSRPYDLDPQRNSIYHGGSR